MWILFKFKLIHVQLFLVVNYHYYILWKWLLTCSWKIKMRNQKNSFILHRRKKIAPHFWKLGIKSIVCVVTPTTYVWIKSWHWIEKIQYHHKAIWSLNFRKKYYHTINIVMKTWLCLKAIFISSKVNIYERKYLVNNEVEFRTTLETFETPEDASPLAHCTNNWRKAFGKYWHCPLEVFGSAQNCLAFQMREVSTNWLHFFHPRVWVLKGNKIKISLLLTMNGL